MKNPRRHLRKLLRMNIMMTSGSKKTSKMVMMMKIKFIVVGLQVP